MFCSELIGKGYLTPSVTFYTPQSQSKRSGISPPSPGLLPPYATQNLGG